MPAKKKATRRPVAPERKAKSRLEKTWKETQAALSSAEGKVEKRVKELVKRSGVDTRQATRTIKAWGGRLDRERKTRLPIIEGNVPPLEKMPKGCRFSTRAPKPHDEAAVNTRPPYEEVSPGHWVEKCPFCFE